MLLLPAGGAGEVPARPFKGLRQPGAAGFQRAGELPLLLALLVVRSMPGSFSWGGWVGWMAACSGAVSRRAMAGLTSDRP
jgi:hypothetical protein